MLDTDVQVDATNLTVCRKEEEEELLIRNHVLCELSRSMKPCF